MCTAGRATQVGALPAREATARCRSMRVARALWQPSMLKMRTPGGSGVKRLFPFPVFPFPLFPFPFRHDTNKQQHRPTSTIPPRGQCFL